MTSNQDQVWIEWREKSKYVCINALKKAGWHAGMGYPTRTFNINIRLEKVTEVYEKVDLADFGLGEGYTLIKLSN